jgi:hypothetical protein
MYVSKFDIKVWAKLKGLKVAKLPAREMKTAGNSVV